MTLRALAALLCVASPAILPAQDRERCFFPNTPQTRQTAYKLPSGQYNTFFGGGVHVICPAKEITLLADSLESYGDDGRIFLVGHVHYDEPRLALTSDFLTYFQQEDRILAQGNVDAMLPDSSTMRGPSADYFRSIPVTRPVPRLIASGRPTITLVQKDSTGERAPPTTVVANKVTMVGDSLVYAGGTVVVTREDVIARGDSMDLDSEREIVVMMRGPLIEGHKDKPYQLSGERIELTSSNRQLRRVLSRGRARAVSEDLTLASDTIDLRIERDLLQRAVAWGGRPSRARAVSREQRITSDSIDVDMPDQRIREMHAVRDAVAEGTPDTTRFRADTLDWLRGDTIIARFDSAAAGDSSRTTRLRELVAMGHARSFYHLPPSDTTLRVPAINYVVGREIIVSMQDQQVSKVTVLDKAAGVYLEPRAVAAAAPPDSARAPGSRTAPAPPVQRARPPK